MTKYHINFEGKVYPCKAKVFKCPYGESSHSDSKVELYYKLMGNHGADAEPSPSALREIENSKRLKSLYALSPDIEDVDYPVDVIVATLKDSIVTVGETDIEEDAIKWRNFELELSERVTRAYQLDIEIPDFVPQNIKVDGLKTFIEKHDSKIFRFRPADDIQQKNIAEERIEMMYHETQEYKDYVRFGLKESNYESTYGWISRDFERFSHDLNTSKMITQPVFYGDLEKAKKTIAEMDNFELLSTLDDYSVTDKEIERNVKEANYFKYEDRNDLSTKANDKVKTWYNRNRAIYENWRVNTPKRVLLSMEVAKELDRRTVIRQDSNVGEMLAEGKDAI